MNIRSRTFELCKTSTHKQNRYNTIQNIISIVAATRKKNPPRPKSNRHRSLAFANSAMVRITAKINQDIISIERDGF